jgi:hypothetical protein
MYMCNRKQASQQYFDRCMNLYFKKNTLLVTNLVIFIDVYDKSRFST